MQKEIEIKKSTIINDHFSKNKLIHFIGIGGVGMSALAKILLEQGYKISGSDLKESINTIHLKDFGAKIFYKQDKHNLRGAGIVIISSAIKEDNPEYLEAKNLQLPIFKRGELLAFLMEQFKRKIAVTGTHGKTTTTAMIASIFKTAQKEPGYLIGSDMNSALGNAELGKPEYFIAESDESDGSFLFLNPNIGVVTNIELEHMDHYKTKAFLLESFKNFLLTVLNNDNSYLVLNKDDENIREISKDLNSKMVYFFGINDQSGLNARNIEFSDKGLTYQLFNQNEFLGEISLSAFGLHNVYNSLSAIQTAFNEKIPFKVVSVGLANFLGTKRRMQLIGSIDDVLIYDDYAHHPTEVKATLFGIKKSFPEKRIICIFQPHRYSRTQEFLSEFAFAFDLADVLIITEVYSANEANINNVSAKQIVEKINNKNNRDITFIANKSQILPTISAKIKKNDFVITMGAGDIYTIAKELLVLLKQK